MIRVEIIATQAVEEDLLDAFKKAGVASYYTKYPVVHGVGTSGSRMGDAIWPEENFVMVVWCEEPEARSIAHAVAQVKMKFPDGGIKVFGI
jgi:hypothetical protein